MQELLQLGKNAQKTVCFNHALCLTGLCSLEDSVSCVLEPVLCKEQIILCHCLGGHEFFFQAYSEKLQMLAFVDVLDLHIQSVLTFSVVLLAKVWEAENHLFSWIWYKIEGEYVVQIQLVHCGNSSRNKFSLFASVLTGSLPETRVMKLADARLREILARVGHIPECFDAQGWG